MLFRFQQSNFENNMIFVRKLDNLGRKRNHSLALVSSCLALESVEKRWDAKVYSHPGSQDNQSCH